MKTHARVVVIGGGIAGCSALFHLTREGWSDVVLVERNDLTSGTTWHSAAQVTNFGPVQTMVGLKSHSIKLYGELAADPEHPINYHHGDGGIRLASDPNHIDGYKHFVSMAKGMGVDFEVIDAAECKRRHPLIETHELLGGLWDPFDGDIDPTQLCQALARQARNAGAQVYRHNPVEALTQKANDEWIVHTKDGDITCEKVVNACGYRVNEVAAMMGIQHPVISMEHQYMLTESIPELEALDHRVPLLRDPLDDFYSRQDRKGLLVGFYEQRCKTWGLDGIDPDFVNALCPDDLDRCMDNMERVFKRLPCLEKTGIQSVVNGPITYTADGLPLVGKIPGKRNAYCIIGLRAGLGEGGGHGKILAEIVTRGESEWDTWCLDPRRFTAYANTGFTALKAIEDYQNEFRFHMPHEHRPAGRKAKTTPIYAELEAVGARFGVVNGWERAAYFAPDAAFNEDHSFRFNNTFDLVEQEVEAVRQRVGVMEVSGFNRYEIRGEGVRDWLDGIMCSRVPRAPGRIGLTYFLNEHGNIKGEATLANLAEDRVWYGSAAAAEYHDMDWLRERLPADDCIVIDSLTNRYTTLVIAGPRSRALLSEVSPRTQWSQNGFPWLHAREAFVGHVRVIAMSVSYSGELAWELHVPNEQLLAVYQALSRAGESFGLQNFGGYAAESMRIEKGFRHWKADLITEFNPVESGLERFVQTDKSFVGKSAMQARVAEGLRRRFVTLAIDADHATAHPGDSILADGNVVGTVTSAAWGYRVGKNLAMGFVQPELAAVGTELGVEVIGELCAAKVVEPCQYDPGFALVR